jgi:hypothetical protein
MSILSYAHFSIYLYLSISLSLFHHTAVKVPHNFTPRRTHRHPFVPLYATSTTRMIPKDADRRLARLPPRSGFDGKPTKAADVRTFVDILAKYGISATPRVRRGIDIDAGCGQLKSKVQKALGRGGAPL